MRKTDIVMLMAGGLFPAFPVAAAKESPQQPPEMEAPSGMESTGKPMEPLLGDPVPPSLKLRKRPARQHDAAPKVSRTPSEPLLPLLDEKNLGLGCSKP